MNSFTGEYEINVDIHLRPSIYIAGRILDMCRDGKRIYIGKYDVSKGISPTSMMTEVAHAMNEKRKIRITAVGNFLEEVLEKYVDRAGGLFER